MNAAATPDAAVRQASARASARSRQVLAQADEHDLQAIVDLVRAVCEVDVAAICVYDDGAFHYLVTSGTEPMSQPAELARCRRAMDTHGLVVISNPGDFYASAPVDIPDGATVGRLCVFDERPRELTPVQEQALLTLADCVGNILRLRLDRLDEADAVPLRRDLEMAARVSHDLRMPLAALDASLELLDDTIDKARDATVDLLVTSARRSVDRMSGLVDGLLRLHELTDEPRRAEVDLEVVARRVCADLRPLIQAAGATVRVDALPTLAADPDLMHSVLLNLVSNAVKFARPGVSPAVRLHGRRTEDGWRVSVVDNGTGIPAAQRGAVFGMFTRLTDSPGHGIGLTTVARIVLAHGGTVGVEDADGPGSEFWFELPDA